MAEKEFKERENTRMWVERAISKLRFSEEQFQVIKRFPTCSCKWGWSSGTEVSFSSGQAARWLVSARSQGVAEDESRGWSTGRLRAVFQSPSGVRKKQESYISMR